MERVNDAGSIATAAVAVLWRAAPRLQVFWARRSPALAFLGGFWAFPGGRAEPADATLIAAAARELEEETGVRIPADEARFVFAGRTVTPAWANIRFDASYYLVEAPASAAPDVRFADGELVAGEWIEPARALELWATGERLTSPVVVRALEALVPGIEDAAARLRDVSADAARHDALRLWDLAPGLGMAGLRSPTLPPATHTNCFVVGDDELIVVDPGSPYPEEQAALDEALDARAQGGRRVAEIWITHHHIDHVGGVEHLRARWSAPVAAHPRTARLLHGQLRVDRELADGETRTLGARRLRPVFTPGHTPGHHAFLEETTGFVLAGDMVAGIGTVVVDPDEGDMAEYLRSLETLRLLDARALLPAHGPVLTEPATTLDTYRRHRLWREERVVDALRTLAAALTAEELVPVVYSDAPPSVHPLAVRSLLAHLGKLVVEGRVEENAGTYRLVS